MSEGISAERTSSWYDDAPITEQQLETIRRDLDHPNSRVGSPFAPFVVRKLLAEVERLNTVLDANRVVRNAAESSSRVYKAVVDRLKVERTRLRAERDQLRTRLGETRDALAVAMELLDRLGDDGPCQLDHHGYCQGHSLHEAPCPHPLARQMVAAWREVDREVPDA